MVSTRSTSARVWIRHLTAREIATYVKTAEPLDKAGAFAIQGKGKSIVKKMSGDYTTIVGLPLSTLTDMLRSFGISP